MEWAGEKVISAGGATTMGRAAHLSDIALQDKHKKNSGVTEAETPYERRRRLGLFYTPPTVISILVDWAVRTSAETILEPSFGGCGFLEKSLERLRRLGASPVGAQVFGCDIAPEAFGYLQRIA
jgi:hypothetical protein